MPAGATSLSAARSPAPTLRHWFTAARLPFSSVAVAPFLAGAFIAWRSGRAVELLPVLVGALAVLLITSGCHLLGEATDQVEDRLTRETGRTRFSGGTLLVADGVISERSARRAAAGCFLAALALGAFVCWLRADWRLAALGSLGILAAALYSLPPVRLAGRGLGELTIAFTYGWLTIATGFLAASGAMPRHGWFLALPQALAIFMVIFLNEFPDHAPDRAAGKRNLVVRLGPERAARLYGLAALLLFASLLGLLVVHNETGLVARLAALPALLLAARLGADVAIMGVWHSVATIEPHCRRGVILNHLVTLAIAALAAA